MKWLSEKQCKKELKQEVQIPNTKENEKDRLSIILENIITMLLIVGLSAIFTLVLSHFVRFTTVIGHSMDNTLYDGEKMLMSVSAYNHKVPSRGDIVIAYRGDLSIQYFVKRVVAIPGDTIEIKNGQVYLNDELLEEDYIKEPMTPTENMDKITLGDNDLFLMGDNRNNSTDSRNSMIGLVSIKNELVGKVIFDISDFKSMGGK